MLFSALLNFIDGGSGIAPFSTPVVVEEFSLRTVHSFIHMGTKVVSLGLKKVRWKILCMVSVIVGQGRAHGRHGNTVPDAKDHHLS